MTNTKPNTNSVSGSVSSHAGHASRSARADRNARAVDPTCTRGASAPKCDRCGARVMEIDMIVDSVHLNMRACDNCDRRVWRREGEVADLREVLSELDSTDTRYRRDYAGR